MHNDFDIIVIGGGPAGLSASTFISRCKWKVLVIDRGSPAGYLASLANVNCFPGFPEAIKGQDLLAKMKKQAELEGVKFVHDSVTALAAETRPVRIMSDKNGEFTCKATIVATGAAVRTNHLQGEKEFLGRGVSYDAMSDAPSVAKRITAVVGRNRKAAEAAVFLARFAERVHFIIPSNKLDMGDKVQEMLQRNKNIEMYFSTSLKKINGDGHVSSITVLSAGQEKEIKVAGLFTYVHEYQPTTSFLEKVVELGEAGAIKVGQNFQTTADGVFACGDALCARPQVPAIAAAQGILAGMAADGFVAGL